MSWNEPGVCTPYGPEIWCVLTAWQNKVKLTQAGWALSLVSCPGREITGCAVCKLINLLSTVLAQDQGTGIPWGVVMFPLSVSQGHPDLLISVTPSPWLLVTS